MRDDPLALLERELVGAAYRRAGRGDGAHPRPGAALGIAAGLLVALAVVASILVAGHRAAPQSAGRRGSHTTPGTVRIGQKLLDELAVLRRPQTAADRRLPAWLTRNGLPLEALHRKLDLSLVRLATVTPWGARVFLVPVVPEGKFVPGGRAAVKRALTGGVRLMVVSGNSAGGGATAADLSTHGELSWQGAGRSFAGGSTKADVLSVVPDGVARVRFVFPAGWLPGGGRHQPRQTVAVAVHGNVAAVRVNRDVEAPPLMIWYAADGHVLRRVGDFAAAAHPVRPPQPGPETALSRRAEKDPSTPNRVWVTPAAGGPRTDYQVHFRLLLGGADYTYRVTGTACPHLTPSGGGGGGTANVRGRIWSDRLKAIERQSWCPGTYRVTATVMDLGRRGTLSHPARPFGSATFTVRP